MSNTPRHPLSTSARDRSSLRLAIGAGEQPAYVYFWGHRTSRDGSLTKSCLSQWFEAAFIVDGITYPTAEHFMMAEKARVFGDHATRDQVLRANTPAQAKALGRAVTNFDDETWNAARFGIVVQANLGKFGQNLALRDFLLRTGDQVLVEAGPVDRVWGIGFAADDTRAHDPATWQGENLLGFALMQVRHQLKSLSP